MTVMRRGESELVRDNYIDFVKGITIFFVVWGHCIQYFCAWSFDFFEDRVFSTIYSFHMPLFMFLSGYVFYWSCKRRTTREVITARVRNIGLPMLLWGGIYYYTRLLMVPGKSVVVKMKDIIVSLLDGTAFFLIFQRAIGIWFLWAVLVSSVCVVVAYNYKCSERWKVCVMFMVGAVLLVFPQNAFCLYVYPYFVFGFLTNRYDLKEKTPSVLVVIAAVVWIVMLTIWQKKYYIYISGILPAPFSEYGLMEQIWIDFFRYAIGLCGSVTVFGIVTSFYERMVNRKITRIICWLGRNTMQIYLLQVVILEIAAGTMFQKIVEQRGNNPLAENMMLYNFLITPLLAVTFIGIILLISKLCKRQHGLYCVLFGRRK